MTTPDWSAELTDPEAVREALGTPPPPLTDYELTSFHVDERETSVTLTFFAFGVPAGAADLWRARGHNAVEFCLVFTRVENLAVDGWSTQPFAAITLAGPSVVLSGPGRQASFTAGGVRAEALRGLLACRAE